MGNGMQIVGGIALLLVYFLFSVGCDPSSLSPRTEIPPTETTASGGVMPTTIVMGSFNIQVFGRAKMSNPDVVDILVDVARRFDILAIQELRSADQDLIPRFVDRVNADGSRYKFIVGPRQGYTTSKEQYVYLYDSEKIELIGQPYIAPVPAGEIHRSPMVAHFRCLNVPSNQAFTFKMINVHVDPDEVATEIPTLASIIDGIEQYDGGEDDLILVGDLNSPPRYFQDFSLFENQYPAIADQWATKTSQNLNRDNIIFNGVNTSEYLAQSGVLNLMLEYNLSVENALQVSDHMPVWAVFSTTEATQSFAAQPNSAQVLR